MEYKMIRVREGTWSKLRVIAVTQRRSLANMLAVMADEEWKRRCIVTTLPCPDGCEPVPLVIMPMEKKP